MYYYQVEATNYSTPSGHAQVAASFWSALALNFRKNWLVFLAIVFSFLIGFSRSFLGVHYFEDVLLGWSIGFTLTMLLIIFWDRFLSIPLLFGFLHLIFLRFWCPFFGQMAEVLKKLARNKSYCGLLFGLAGELETGLELKNLCQLFCSVF